MFSKVYMFFLRPVRRFMRYLCGLTPDKPKRQLINFQKRVIKFHREAATTINAHADIINNHEDRIDILEAILEEITSAASHFERDVFCAVCSNTWKHVAQEQFYLKDLACPNCNAKAAMPTSQEE